MSHVRRRTKKWSVCLLCCGISEPRCAAAWVWSGPGLQCSSTSVSGINPLYYTVLCGERLCARPEESHLGRRQGKVEVNMTPQTLAGEVLQLGAYSTCPLRQLDPSHISQLTALVLNYVRQWLDLTACTFCSAWQVAFYKSPFC